MLVQQNWHGPDPTVSKAMTLAGQVAVSDMSGGAHGDFLGGGGGMATFYFWSWLRGCSLCCELNVCHITKSARLFYEKAAMTHLFPTPPCSLKQLGHSVLLLSGDAMTANM